LSFGYWNFNIKYYNSCLKFSNLMNWIIGITYYGTWFNKLGIKIFWNLNWYFTYLTRMNIFDRLFLTFNRFYDNFNILRNHNKLIFYFYYTALYFSLNTVSWCYAESIFYLVEIVIYAYSYWLINRLWKTFKLI
jgi:hypothetical protein